MNAKEKIPATDAEISQLIHDMQSLRRETKRVADTWLEFSQTRRVTEEQRLRLQADGDQTDGLASYYHLATSPHSRPQP